MSTEQILTSTTDGAPISQSKLAKTMVKLFGGLVPLPGVGAITGTMVDLFWPKGNKTSYWDAVKGKVEHYVESKIAETQLNSLQSILYGNLEAGGGVQEHFQDAKKDAANNSPQDVLEDFDDAIDLLLNNIGLFVDKNNPVNTLPYFVEMGSMLLMALISCYDLLNKNPNLQLGKRGHTKAWYKRKYREKVKAFSNYAESAMDKVIEKRGSYISELQEKPKVSMGSYYYYVTDSITGTIYWYANSWYRTRHNASRDEKQIDEDLEYSITAREELIKKVKQEAKVFWHNEVYVVVNIWRSSLGLKNSLASELLLIPYMPSQDHVVYKGLKGNIYHKYFTSYPIRWISSKLIGAGGALSNAPLASSACDKIVSVWNKQSFYYLDSDGNLYYFGYDDILGNGWKGQQLTGKGGVAPKGFVMDYLRGIEAGNNKVWICDENGWIWTIQYNQGWQFKKLTGPKSPNPGAGSVSFGFGISADQNGIQYFSESKDTKDIYYIWASNPKDGTSFSSITNTDFLVKGNIKKKSATINNGAFIFQNSIFSINFKLPGQLTVNKVISIGNYHHSGGAFACNLEKNQKVFYFAGGSVPDVDQNTINNVFIYRVDNGNIVQLTGTGGVYPTAPLAASGDCRLAVAHGQQHLTYLAQNGSIYYLYNKGKGWTGLYAASK